MKGISFPKSFDSPLPTPCRKELDAVPETNINDASHCQSLVGAMDSCSALPLEVHLEILYIIFSNLKKHHVTEMGFDLSKKVPIIVTLKERIRVSQILVAQSREIVSYILKLLLLDVLGSS